MIEISLERIRSQVFECLNTALEKILKNGNQEASSFGFWIDGSFGKCGIALNDDDDNSYRCPEIATFTQRHIFGVWLEEIGDLDSRTKEPNRAASEAEALISVIAEGERIINHRSIESFCKWLHQKAIAWVSDWFATTVGARLMPCWINVEESSQGLIKIWRHGKRPLPPENASPAFPGNIRDLPIPETGLKVYRLSSSRKYCYNRIEYKPGNPRFIGVSIMDQVNTPLPLKTYKKWLKIGSLAESGMGTFALRENDPAFAEIWAFLSPNAEFIPANDSDENWWLVNVLAVGALLDPAASQFRKYGGQIDAVNFAEFDVDALREMKSSIFKLQESPSEGPFFLERPDEESFPQFSRRKRLHGLDWELIWCEDTTGIETALNEFVVTVDSRLMRIEGTCSVKDSVNFECLSGLQEKVWKISRFRELVTVKGVLEALNQVTGVGSLQIAAIRRKLGDAWQYENYPRQQGIESSLEKAFKRRDLLLDLRGFMCCCLPVVIKELRNMEMYGTGRRAAFGPEI